MAARTQIPSFQVLYHELVRAPWICLSAMRAESASADSVGSAGGDDPVLVLGGLFSRPFYYAPLGRTVRQRGYAVHFDDVVNARPFRPHLVDLRARVLEIAAEAGVPVRIIGHSLGGLHAMALLADLPESIAQVIAVGSPIVGGTPWKPLQRVAERVLQVEGSETLGLRERAAPYVDRVTTISSPGDMVAPPTSCVIDGARNIILSDVPPRDVLLASHGGMIFMQAAVRTVLASLAAVPPLQVNPGGRLDSLGAFRDNPRPSSFDEVQ